MQEFEFKLLDGRLCRLSAQYQAKIIQSDLDPDWGIKKPEFFENGMMDMYVDGEFTRQFSYSRRWSMVEEYDNWPFCLFIGSVVIRFPDKQTADRYLEWISGIISSGTTKEAGEYLRQREEKEAAEKQKFEQLRKEREERKNRWEVVKTYRFTKPSGGEEGVDGFSDREYRNASTGNVIRMIQRDVFDVGKWCYPKRLAGIKGSGMDGWTDEEKDLAAWLSEFGFGTGVRM